MKFTTFQKANEMEQNGVANGVSIKFNKSKRERIQKKNEFRKAKDTVLEKEVARDRAKEAVENIHFPHIIKKSRAKRKLRLAKRELELAYRKRNQAKLEYKKAKSEYKEVRKTIRDQYKKYHSYDKLDKVMKKTQEKGLDLTKNPYIMNQIRQAIENNKGEKFVFDEKGNWSSAIRGIPPGIFKDIKSKWQEYKKEQKQKETEQPVKEKETLEEYTI